MLSLDTVQLRGSDELPVGVEHTSGVPTEYHRLVLKLYARVSSLIKFTPHKLHTGQYVYTTTRANSVDVRNVECAIIE